jgi:uncharacterized delta-60 repeat protein
MVFLQTLSQLHKQLIQIAMKKQILLIVAFIFSMLKITYSQPGTLDGDFDADGKVTTDFNTSIDQGRAVAIQQDQKIVVAGISHNGTDNDFALVRYNIDGTLDNSFGDIGKVITDINNNDYVHDLAIQPDGKIVVAGHTYPGANYDVTLVRYNTDGTLDNSFSSDGIVFINVGNEDQCLSIALQEDGKIVAVGFYNNGTDKDLTVVRFTTGGSLDESFGDHGIVTTAIGGADEIAESVVIQSDGKIITAGYYDNGTDNDFALARFNSDGELDDSFGENGIVKTPVGSFGDVAVGVVLQSDGKIVVAGHSDNGSDRDIAILRYNADGSLDDSFDSNGIVLIPIGDGEDYCEDITLQPDGKILVTGYSFNGENYDFFVLRCNTDGSPDDAFGDDGIVITPFGSSNDYGKEIAVQENGRIVVAGFSNNGENDDFAVARYLSGLNLGIVHFTDQDQSVLVYPNPIDNETTLKYELTENETIGIVLYDIQGRLVHTFISQEQRLAGQHEETLNIDSSIPAGCYLLVITNEAGNKGIQINIR